MAIPWGGYQNGRIPLSSMSVVRGERFNPEAARQLLLLESAFEKRFGYQAVINDGYRDYAGQLHTWETYLKGGPLSAYPGTSNHGWGKAADFGSRVQYYGTIQKNWMNANAPYYGWHPTGDKFIRPEAWHFDYLGNPVIRAGTEAERIEEQEQEEKDMTQPGQVHWVRSDKKIQRALFVPGTAYWLSWTEGGSNIANGFARNMGTGSSTAITASMALAMQNAAEALLPKAIDLGAVTVEVNATELTASIEQGLKDDFATIPSAVVSEIGKQLGK